MTGGPSIQPSNEHTPTPWECDWGPIPPDGPGTYCDVYIDGGDTIIARVNDCIASGHANAAFIVEAVNSHELLKQKLEFAEFEWNRATEGMKERDATIAALVKALEAVEFRGHQGKCPLCAGWDMSPSGETPGKHTKDCLIAAALSHRSAKT